MEKTLRPIFFFIILVFILFAVRAQNLSLLGDKSQGVWSERSYTMIDSMRAGVLPGLMSDFLLMDVFAINYTVGRQGESGNLIYFYPYLNRAQHLDPRFFDVYRLAGTLLAYDANEPRKAISLLEKGVFERPDTWEFPFFAGFIAYDVLQDERLAYDMMSQVATRKNTPLSMITLSARFLASASSVEDSLSFLKSLVGLVPKDLQKGLLQRIHEIESGEPALPARH